MATLTQQRQHESFRTPHRDDPVWDRDPPLPPDPRDHKAIPHRVRGTIGEHYFLIETVDYTVYIPGKPKNGKKTSVPCKVQQVRCHFLHSRFLTTRTFKVYRHQSDTRVIEWGNGNRIVDRVPRILYADSNDFKGEHSGKVTPPKDRTYALGELARMLQCTPAQAEARLDKWVTIF